MHDDIDCCGHFSSDLWLMCESEKLDDRIFVLLSTFVLSKIIVFDTQIGEEEKKNYRTNFKFLELKNSS